MHRHMFPIYRLVKRQGMNIAKGLTGSLTYRIAIIHHRDMVYFLTVRPEMLTKPCQMSFVCLWNTDWKFEWTKENNIGSYFNKSRSTMAVTFWLVHCGGGGFGEQTVDITPSFLFKSMDFCEKPLRIQALFLTELSCLHIALSYSYISSVLYNSYTK